MSSNRKLATVLSITVIACGAGASAASAMPEITNDSTSVQPASVTRDLRSPDTRDAASSYSPSVPQQAPVVRDVRSPDTRDVAEGYAPELVPEPVAVSAPSDGFDWVSAAIGAAVIGALLLLLMAFRPTHTGRRHALHT